MDNVTHSLSGLFLADCLLFGSDAMQRRMAPNSKDPTRATGFRRRIAWIAMVAGNAPDLDLLYTGVTPGKLGYLLHHRGHTHTVGSALALGLLVTTVVLLIGKLQGAKREERRHWLPWCTGAVSALLHLSLDLGNNYGIHPLWPFDNRWFYGDTFFIVEPWLLLILMGTALAHMKTAVSRGVLWCLALGLFALTWSLPGWTPAPLAAALTGAGLAWLFWLRNAPPRRRLTAGAIALLLQLLGSTLGRQLAVAQVRTALPQGERTLDIVATPAPANPLCWSAIAVLKRNNRYSLRLAQVSALPQWLSTESCPEFASARTAPLRPVASAPARRFPLSPEASSGVSWLGEFSAPLTEFHHLVRSRCRMSAFLRFARAPFWTRPMGQGPIQVGDLRFDRSAEADFSEITVRPSDPCPQFEPTWLPPRQDLLGPETFRTEPP